MAMRDQAYGLRRLVEEQDGFSVSLYGSLSDKMRFALAILEEIDEEEIPTASILTSITTAKRALTQAVKKA